MGQLRRIGAIVTSVAAMTAAVQCFAAVTSSAAPCPDAEVVFARGTTEAPGAGPTGDAFIDALRARVGPKSVGVYAVDYPATLAFSTAVQGIADARAHIVNTVATCPTTKLVLSGFSQGAAVIGFVTASVVPDGVSPDDVPAPMPPEVADHVAAVALFGKPSARFMNVIKDPEVVIGPNYVAKSIALCADNDLVCDPRGSSFSVHDQYPELGLADQGAAFAAQRLLAAWAADAATAPDVASLSVVDQGAAQHLVPSAPAAPGPAPLPGPTAPAI
jgi:hypothetical protein